MARYLERHGRKWRVVVPVPRSLHGRLGTKLKETLPTESLETANRLKWAVVQRFQAQIASAQNQQELSPAVLTQEALQWRQHSSGNPVTEDAIMDRTEAIQGHPIGQSATGEPIYDERREELALQYYRVATGESTPLTSLIEDWHAEGHRRERTKGDDVRALRNLSNWCELTSTPQTIEVMTRRTAGAFVRALIRPSSLNEERPLTAKTANKYISSLSSYWQWMERRGYVSENIWLRQSVPTPIRRANEEERPFTDDEVRSLLGGSPSHRTLPALMRIGALTGARIEAITSLRVKDCNGGIFVFKPQKRERGEREVPIHSFLIPIIAELTAGKGPDDDLFPELPVPPEGSSRERSMPASKAFTRYRRLVGVDEVVGGNRRSRVNFHSFRRWFATKAEQAGQPEHIIAAVLGHKRPGMTLGLYSRGPSLDQLRDCVEAVRLPN